MAGTAESGRAALNLLRKTTVDIILVDLRMPGFSGIETLNAIRQIAPAIRCIVLSSFEFDEEIYAAVKAGAKGYLHKEAPADEILKAIRSVHSGRRAFPRRIAERLSNERMTAGLSPRERGGPGTGREGANQQGSCEYAELKPVHGQKSPEPYHREA